MFYLVGILLYFRTTAIDSMDKVPGLIRSYWSAQLINKQIKIEFRESSVLN